MTASDQVCALKTREVFVMKQRPFSSLTFLCALLAAPMLARPANADPEVAEKLTGAVIDVEGYVYSTLKKGQMLSHPKWPYLIMVAAVDGKTLRVPVVVHLSTDRKIDSVVQAKEGKLSVQDGNKLILELHQGSGTNLEDGSQIKFEKKTWEMSLPADFGK
jgi:hypothetical protein